MPGSVHRLSVQTDGDRTIDLVLPSDTPLAALLPMIREAAGSPQGTWYLSRLNGRRIDESVSLDQNMIDDGDLLILTPASSPALPRRPHDLFETTATIGAPSDCDSPSMIPPLVFVWSVVVATVWLCAQGGDALGALVAGAGCVGSLVAASRGDALIWCCSAILFGASAGFLTVPSTPAAPNALLATTAASAVAWIAAKLHPCVLTVGAGTVSACAPLAVATAAATLHPAARDAVGATISALALTLLTSAPRLAVLVSGLEYPAAPHDSAMRTHRILTGLIAGSAVAAAMGTGLAATGQHRAAPVLCWLVAVALLLRSTWYPDPTRRWSVSISGLLCATAAFIVTVRAVTWAPWLALAVVFAGLATLRIQLTNALVERVISRIEVVALTLVAPVGLWVADIYTKVRSG